MNDQTDSQLLRAYAEHRSEPAFAECRRRREESLTEILSRISCSSRSSKTQTYLTANYTKYAKGFQLETPHVVSYIRQTPVRSGVPHRRAAVASRFGRSFTQ